ncbi:hypothetical protein PSHT_00932 [Puccinia striiformis]|uniref:Cutinase n=1 Tax=Puccinia striiformis TaxID=27350 RepID=A0A2S4WLS2_9BASI|nr:hypothetical protein PSHT_00932 [Puccinia striiformis]
MLFPSSLIIAFVLLKLTNASHIRGAYQPQETVAQPVASAEASTSDTCGAYQIVAARGTTESQSGSIAYANLIKTVEATIPRGSNVEIQYSSSMEYVKSVEEGIESGAAHLTAQMAKCPDQKYVFVGYSKGAMVIQNMMSKLPIAADKVVALVMFGNPFHTPGAPQNRCSGVNRRLRDGFTICESHAIRVRLTNLRLLQTMGPSLSEVGISYGPYVIRWLTRREDATEFVVSKLRADTQIGTYSSK